MDVNETILTIVITKQDENEEKSFKLSSKELITYNDLIKESKKNFNLSEIDEKYITFSYLDNEQDSNIVYPEQNLVEIAKEIAPHNLLLKLDFSINFYQSVISRNSIISKKNSENQNNIHSSKINAFNLNNSLNKKSEIDISINKIKNINEENRRQNNLNNNFDSNELKEYFKELMNEQNKYLEQKFNDNINENKNLLEKLYNALIDKMDDSLEKIDKKYQSKLKEITNSYDNKISQLEKNTNNCLNKIDKLLEIIQQQKNKQDKNINNINNISNDKINIIDNYFNQEIHENIQCSKCTIKPIRGIRYKCQICENYNLCYKCHNQIISGENNEHNNHNFIEIIHPEKKQFVQNNISLDEKVINIFKKLFFDSKSCLLIKNFSKEDIDEVKKISEEAKQQKKNIFEYFLKYYKKIENLYQFDNKDEEFKMSFNNHFNSLLKQIITDEENKMKYIQQFREIYNIPKKEFSDEGLNSALVKTKGDMEKTFSSLFEK